MSAHRLRSRAQEHDQAKGQFPFSKAEAERKCPVLCLNRASGMWVFQVWLVRHMVCTALTLQYA